MEAVQLMFSWKVLLNYNTHSILRKFIIIYYVHIFQAVMSFMLIFYYFSECYKISLHKLMDINLQFCYKNLI